MEKLSVLIPAFNNEAYIRPCLESVRWADEILVCDSFSTDKTVEIAKSFGARIIQHEYLNSATQKNWALPQCRHNWVLEIDTDEILEEGLKAEIKEWLSKDPIPFDGFRVPRKNFVYGKWMKHGGIYPDYNIRLFRKSQGRFENREVHASLILSGKAGTLKHHLIHDGFKDVSSWLIKIERYTRYERDEWLKRKKPFPVAKHLLAAPLIFVNTYFLKLGCLEGYRGFLLSVLDAFNYFLVGARLWETAHSKDISSS